jgi:hypothetical protein
MVARWRLKPTVEFTIIAIGAVGGETGAGYAGGSAISADDARQRTAEFNGSRLKVIDFRQWRIPQAAYKNFRQNVGVA